MSDTDHEPTPSLPSGRMIVPLFPLPNVVLFPRAILPLHIFEERYKTMTADALAGDRQVAMALLQPGWERDYYAKPALAPVVCIGTILTHEKLPDGKYNFLLQGHTRAKIRREVGDRAYRLAEVDPLPEEPVMEIDLINDRQRLASLLSESEYSRLPLARQFLQMLSSSLSTSDVIDLIAFNFIDDVALKQALLSEPDARVRVERVLSAVESVRPRVSVGDYASGQLGSNLN